MPQKKENPINNFYKYCSQFSRLVIYGAGDVGKMVAGFMEEKGIKFSSFCVTGKPEQQMSGSYLIKGIDEVTGSDEYTDIGIIVAVSSKNAGGILHLLDRRKVSYFYDPEFLFQLYRRICQESASKVLVQNGYICQISETLFDRDSLYICCPASIGDTLYTAAFVKAFKEINQPIRRACLILKKSHRELGPLFPAVDEVLVSDEITEILDRYSLFTQTWKLKNYIYGHFKKSLRFEYDPEYNQEKCRAILPRYRRLIMELSEDAQPESMNLPVRSASLENWKIKERKVILMPYAKTAEMLQENFWKELARRLKRKGYSVYTNIGSEKEKAIQGTRPLTKSLLETACFCEGCAAVISLRSGLCDLLGFTETKLVVINTSEELFREWNLNDVFTRDGIYNINCYGHTNCCYGNRIDEIMGIVGG